MAKNLFRRFTDKARNTVSRARSDVRALDRKVDPAAAKAESVAQTVGSVPKRARQDARAVSRKVDPAAGKAASAASRAASGASRVAGALEDTGDRIDGALPDDRGDTPADRAARAAATGAVIEDATLAPLTAPQNTAMNAGGGGEMRVDDLAFGSADRGTGGGQLGEGLTVTGGDSGPRADDLVTSGGETADQGDGDDDPLSFDAPLR